MPKFKVWVEETRVAIIEVKAEDAQLATDLALKETLVCKSYRRVVDVQEARDDG